MKLTPEQSEKSKKIPQLEEFPKDAFAATPTAFWWLILCPSASIILWAVVPPREIQHFLTSLIHL